MSTAKRITGRAALWLIVGASVAMMAQAQAQVRSVTLGIRTHCPYGIRGCWPEIRDGLETPRAITAINGEPDIETDTCEVGMREDWVADPDLFQRNFLEMRIGVDVRGVEAVVDGQLVKEQTNLVLRVGSNGGVLVLKPLTAKVQWDKKRQQPEAATGSEQNAYRELSSAIQAFPARVRITGPLRSEGTKGSRVLEVRKFEMAKTE